MKSSWPTMEAFTKHWYKSHCSDRMWQWQEISDELSVAPADLVSKIFGPNLDVYRGVHPRTHMCVFAVLLSRPTSQSSGAER